MTESNEGKKSTGDVEEYSERTPWRHILRGMWRSPLGLLGVTMTVASITLMVVGLGVDMLGLVDNPYANILTYMILPGGMMTGLALIPLAAFLRRRQWHKFGISKDHLRIDLSDKRHRKFLIGFVALSVINVSVMVVVGYEGYHFTDSPTFCGVVCHQVMEPEYTVYQRSNHANIACVECHIGPGVSWFVKAKISGLRQVVGVLTDNYSRPIPAPVEQLRSAHDTCEECHWPDKFYDTKIVVRKHFSNDDQKNPEVNKMIVHVGGRNPETKEFEGVHWHASRGVEIKFLAADESRKEIARVKVKRPDGSTDEFVKSDVKIEGEGTWRAMDCIDCHNRPTHAYDMPEDVVDFGLLTKELNPDMAGIREDSLTAMTAKYATRDEASAKIGPALMELQAKRNPKLTEQQRADIDKAAAYLVKSYLGNVWPKTEVTWGNYKSHVGHRYADDGYGCFRCHDDEHENATGKTIPQDCDFCHDEPE